jgi:hypothetical protein
LLILPFQRQRTFYVESSGWDAVQRRGGLDSEEALLILSAVQRGRIKLVAGVFVFEELLPLYGCGDTKRADERVDIIGSLADLSATIRNPTEIIRERVVSVLTGEPLPPDTTDGYRDLAAAKRKLFSARHEIETLTRPGKELEAASVREMNGTRAAIRKELEASGWPKLNYSQFRGLVTVSPQGFIDNFFGEGPPVPESILTKLSNERSLRMYHEGLISMFYEQTYLNRRPKPGDLRDLHHAVSASLTSGLVTNDKDLRSWVSRVSLPEFETLSLEDFVRLKCI